MVTESLDIASDDADRTVLRSLDHDIAVCRKQFPRSVNCHSVTLPPWSRPWTNQIAGHRRHKAQAVPRSPASPARYPIVMLFAALI